MPDGEAEDVDHLVDIRTNEMRPENAASVLFGIVL